MMDTGLSLSPVSSAPMFASPLDRRELLRRTAYHRSAGLSWDAAAGRITSPVVSGAELEELAQAYPDDYNSFLRSFQKRRVLELQADALNALAGLLEAKNPRVVLALPTSSAASTPHSCTAKSPSCGRKPRPAPDRAA